jgi:hypothetical protein
MDRERRKHVRVTGPFEGVRLGVLDIPVLIYDLSVGGCFINATHDAPRTGSRFELTIDLPGEGTVTVEGETVHARPGFGYAVRFTRTTAEARGKLTRLIERLKK